MIKSAAAAIKSKYMMRDKSDNKYHIEGKIYEKIRGTRQEVWCGAAYQTTGELKKRDLEMNRYGKIVSKVKLIKGNQVSPLTPPIRARGQRGQHVPLKNNKRCKYFLLFIFFNLL